MSFILNLIYAGALCFLAYFAARYSLKIFNRKKFTPAQITTKAKIFSICLFLAFSISLILEKLGIF